MICRFGRFTVEVDEIATKNWYANADMWSCDCGYCRNFLQLARNDDLPDPVMEALHKLKIPPIKATYVSELYDHLYQFSYRVAGNILSGTSKPDDTVICGHEIYPYGAPDFPEPHFDLIFFEKLPWVIDEPYTG